jgi:hypothetical protein
MHSRVIAEATPWRVGTVGGTWFVGSGFRRSPLLSRRYSISVSTCRIYVGRLPARMALPRTECLSKPL